MLRYLSIFSYLFLAALAAHSPAKRHTALAHRKRGDVALYERGQSFQGARATWYQTGLGGCGIWNNPGDFIVALNFPMFGDIYPGPLCFQKITIEYQGKTAVAQITDACEACPAYGGIDMSKGLFEYFADPAGGVISVNWWFGGDDSPPEPTTSKWQAPAPKWTPAPATHSASTPKPTPTPTPTHSSHSSSSSSSSSSKSTSTSSAPQVISTPAGANNIANLYQVILGLGRYVVAGASN